MRYIRLIEIMDQQDLTILKLALNEADIEYITLYEQTLSTVNVYALGSGGAVIEVAETDLERANEVLQELGIDLNYNSKKDRFHFINIIEKITDRLPFISTLALELRFLILTISLLLLIFCFILVSSVRISTNDLIGDDWCVDIIMHNGVQLQPKTQGLFILHGFGKNCREEMYFGESGEITLPGFNTYSIDGRWKFLSKDVIEISEVTDFKSIYEGDYHIITNLTGTMLFKSDQTSITISSK